jgi:hypothetical protein
VRSASQDGELLGCDAAPRALARLPPATRSRRLLPLTIRPLAAQSSANYSHLRVVRASELLGAQLTAIAGRESMVYQVRPQGAGHAFGATGRIQCNEGCGGSLWHRFTSVCGRSGGVGLAGIAHGLVAVFSPRAETWLFCTKRLASGMPLHPHAHGRFRL